MASVTSKREIGPLDGTPLKRMFWSNISDYGLRTGICELVDNAIDMWMIGGRRKSLQVDIEINTYPQIIRVIDNAGGVKQEDLSLLISPGGSRNDPNDPIIGIFGVGGKRAGVALGERVNIKTRFGRSSTYELEITPGWLESDDWHLPYSEVPEIGITIPATLIAKAKHYYLLRNKLIHKRVTADVTDADIRSYRSAAEKILTILFGLKF